MTANYFKNIDEYIASFPKDIQEILQQIRETAKKAAPAEDEAIKYAMPTFTHHGNLVHFAVFKNHIGFHPAPNGDDVFKKELSIYRQGKGSVQFALSEPRPLKLITQIVKLRLKTNWQKLTKSNI